MTFVYNYHPVSGEFINSHEARMNPREPKKVLVPKNSTLIEPPVGIPGKVRVFSEGAWSQVDDHRGETWFDAEGESMVITDLIDPEAEGLFETAPVVELTLEELRAAKINEIESHGAAILTGEGFPYDFGVQHGIQHLQTRNAEDRTNWLTSQGAYKAQIEAGNGAVLGASFRTAENNTITVSFLDGYALLLEMASWGAGLYGVAWAKKDLALAAVDEAALNAIDVETGW